MRLSSKFLTFARYPDVILKCAFMLVDFDAMMGYSEPTERTVEVEKGQTPMGYSYIESANEREG